MPFLLKFNMFICFFCFVLGFIVPLDNFSLIWETSPLPMECCKFWPFFMVISEDPWHSHHCWAFSTVAVTIFFYVFKSIVIRLGMSRLGFEHPTFLLQRQRSNPLRHPNGWMQMELYRLTACRFYERRSIRLVIELDCNFQNSF